MAADKSPFAGEATKIGSVSVKLVRYPALAWLLHPNAAFQLVILLFVILSADEASKIRFDSLVKCPDKFGKFVKF